MLTFTQCKPPYENGTFTDPPKLHFMMAIGTSTMVDTHGPGEVGGRTKGLYRIPCMMGDRLDVGDRLDNVGQPARGGPPAHRGPPGRWQVTCTMG